MDCEQIYNQLWSSVFSECFSQKFQQHISISISLFILFFRMSYFSLVYLCRVFAIYCSSWHFSKLVRYSMNGITQCQWVNLKSLENVMGLICFIKYLHKYLSSYRHCSKPVIFETMMMKRPVCSSSRRANAHTQIHSWMVSNNTHHNDVFDFPLLVKS